MERVKRQLELMACTEQHICSLHYPLTKQELKKVRPGDYIKVGFKVPGSPGGKTHERMWIKVREVEHGRFIGDLANDPTLIPRYMLKDGDEIVAPHDKVLDILHYDRSFSVMQARSHN